MARTMTLKNGKKVPQAIALQVWGVLIDLHGRMEVYNQLVLVELVKACRDQSHKVSDMCKRRLVELPIVERIHAKTGVAVIDDDVRCIVTLAAQGEAKRGKITLVSPFRGSR